jgi:hypothetical protein
MCDDVSEYIARLIIFLSCFIEKLAGVYIPVHFQYKLIMQRRNLLLLAHIDLRVTSCESIKYPVLYNPSHDIDIFTLSYSMTISTVILTSAHVTIISLCWTNRSISVIRRDSATPMGIHM